MRKWLKIKAIVLSLAWLVIFLHEAIPHNHSNHQESSCHSIVHSSDPGNNHTDDEINYTQAVSGGDETSPGWHGIKARHSHNHHESTVCHFSANLFSKHSASGFDAILSESVIPYFDLTLVTTFTLQKEKGYSSAEPVYTPQRGPPSRA